MKDHYYAHFHDEQYYIGRIIDLNPTECTFEFLRETKEKSICLAIKVRYSKCRELFHFL